MNYFDLNRYSQTINELNDQAQRAELFNRVLFHDRNAHFAGPSSYLRKAVEIARSSLEARVQLLKLVAWLDNGSLTKDQDKTWKDYEAQWHILKALLELQLGSVDNETRSQSEVVTALYQSIETSVCRWSVFQKPMESKAFSDDYQDALSECAGRNLGGNSEQWSYAEFVLYVLLKEWKQGSFNTSIESVPILLGASNTEGTAIRLVAQSIPGPANVVVPNWFKLGLVHLGKNFDLCREISLAMSQVNATQGGNNSSILWWLEAEPDHAGYKWHGRIAEAGNSNESDSVSMAISAQLPAGCLAKALGEKVPESARPLLDPTVGFSGGLSKTNGGWICTPVGFLGGKLIAAGKASLRSVYFPSGDETKEQLKAVKNVAPEVFRSQVATLEEAYQSGLRTNWTIVAAKARSRKDWETKHLEVETHDDFFKATDNVRAFDRANETTKLRSPIETQRTTKEDSPSFPSTSLDNIYNDDGSLQSGYSDHSQKDREYFLVRQPFWYADSNDVNERWSLAKQEEEPEIAGLQSAFTPPPTSVRGSETPSIRAAWRRITRQHLIECAMTNDDSWKHVAVVCSAGLGKTTNFRFLEAAVNMQFELRGPLFAVYIELYELEKFDNLSDLRKKVVNRIMTCLPASKTSEEDVYHAYDRMYLSGQILYLVDSLDQADHSSTSNAMQILKLMVNDPSLKHNEPSSNRKVPGCKVWLSGRSYAFFSAEAQLKSMALELPWQFLRVGQLDEPEARQLIETGPGVRPLSIERA